MALTGAPLEVQNALEMSDEWQVILSGTPGFTATRVVYVAADGSLTGKAGFTFDPATDILAIPDSLTIKSGKVVFDPTVADSSASVVAKIDTDNAVTQAGFKWAGFYSAGTLRGYMGWGAGSAFVISSNSGRMDFEATGNSIYFTASQFFMQASAVITKTAAASSTATQKNSNQAAFQPGLWTGAAQDNTRYGTIFCRASTSVNQKSYLTFWVDRVNLAGGTEMFTLSSTGYAGVKQTEPVSTLDVGGSLSLKVTTSSAASLSLDDTASVYVFTGSSATTWSLPAISGCAGRTYWVKNRGTANITLDPNSSEQLWPDSAQSTMVVAPNEAFVIVNDGTYWIVM